MKLIADVMFFENGIEKLNIVAFCGRERVGELFSLCFFSSTLLLCCAYTNMYEETSKDRSSKARFQRLWTAGITGHGQHGGSQRVFIST